MSRDQGPQELLDQVGKAVARSTATGDGTEVLEALAALHLLREQLLAWEPALIEAAREQGVSWSRLAPVLGVTSRQAAERRYLRLKPGQGAGLTREQRVRATRDERAADRAVADWARTNAAKLRQVAGQVSAAKGLSSSGRRRARTLATSLTGDDPVDLIEPLARMHADLVDDHAQLAAEVDAVGRRVRRVRKETQRRRDGTAQS
ncbi:MAG: hypothetical protein ACRDPR_00245 [Nocardioidaceae bacterium]